MNALKKTTLTLMCLSVLLTGCDEDFLNETNPNAPTTATFWKTADDATKATNAVYEGMTYEGMYMRMMHALQDFRGDDVAGDSPWSALQSIGLFNLPPTEASPTWAWRDAYHGVYRANQVLAYVPDIEMDEGLKSRLLGETKFLRAFYYFHLVKMFNNVPLILTPAVSSEDYLQPQAPPEEVWNQIVKDLQEAQAVLPQSYSQEIGRATWGAQPHLGAGYLLSRRHLLPVLFRVRFREE